MKTDVKTPLALFKFDQVLGVPLYQRRYVWEAEQQWAPLWQDVLRTADLRAAGGQGTHFLGAAVLQRREEGAGALAAWEIVDGQQRLTTLQLMVDAVAGVLAELGQDRLVRQLEKLTTNDPDEVDDEQDSLKLRHRNDDGLPYHEVMVAPAPVAHDELVYHEERIVRAHRFFSEAARAHLTGDEEQASALVDALRQGLELVVITLDAQEDSQVIFETLNARGTPLTATDLIKNFVLHRVENEGGSPEDVWRRQWHVFDDEFWTQDVNAGRTVVSRSTLFLHHWLISRTGREISQSRLFAEFKHFVEHETSEDVCQLITQIVDVAAVYRRLQEEALSDAPNISRPALALHRFAAMNTQVALPLVIWLVDPRNGVAIDTAERVIDHLESWVARRMVLRTTTADLGRVSAAIAARLESSDEPADELVLDHLSELTAPSTYWPRDDEVRRQLATMPVYRTMARGRLRMLLEAIEDAERGFAGGKARSAARVARGTMHIEHLLPQRWQPNWPVGDDPERRADREEHVHRLGNLTLLTGRLNASVSNRAWTGERGKWAALDAHDDNLMTRRVRREHPDGWNENTIDERTSAMVDTLLTTWSGPADGAVVDATAAVAARVDTLQGVSLADLVETGHLQAGQTLYFLQAGSDQTATLTDEGHLVIAGTRYTKLIDATRHFDPEADQSWWRWLTEDDRHLARIRKQLFEELEGSREG